MFAPVPEGPASLVARTWSGHRSACDKAAAAFYDPDRLVPGIAQNEINANIANSACSAEAATSANSARVHYEFGRALLAKHEMNPARQQLETAVSKGYHAAQVDLANLLVDQSTGMLESKRAISLYERAWRGRIPYAAFMLGHVYEYGVRGLDANGTGDIKPDSGKAWYWYQQAADKNLPNALARLAERDEANAVAETEATKKDALLLQAFTRYAAAVARASREAWPVETWRAWRYRRATLARLLAENEMMQQVANPYKAILDGAKPEGDGVF